MEDIFKRAAQLGLEIKYWNAFGELRAVSPEVLAKLVDALAPADAPGQSQIVRGSCEASVAPAQAYQGDAAARRRMWALAVQLYGIRSRRNWGHGDFSDLLALIDLAADVGAAGIGLNPLHALFDDRAELASPYSPNSRLFLNPLYTDVEALPEFPGPQVAGVQRDIERLRDQRLVDYERVARVKARALKLAHENFLRGGNTERRRAFDRFRAQRGTTLARFACFELLRRRFAGPWWDWPQQWRTADAQSLERLRADEGPAVEFFEFVQWAAHEQLERCRARCAERRLPIGLYLDVAVGVRNDGFDAWCDQKAIVSGVAIGAPPDELNRGGQNWGLAAFNPIALEMQQFEPFRRMLRASMQYSGAVRLDHVLGLQRLYLIPHRVPASEGTYIRCPFEALLAVTALTSVEQKCIVIGEDLGTVPEKFRETLASWGVWSYQVMLFERTAGGGFVRPESYREQALLRLPRTICRRLRPGGKDGISPSSRRSPSTPARAANSGSARSRRCARRSDSAASRHRRPVSLLRSRATWPTLRRDWWSYQSRTCCAYSTRPTCRERSMSIRIGGTGCPSMWKICASSLACWRSRTSCDRRAAAHPALECCGRRCLTPPPENSARHNCLMCSNYTDFYRCG